MESKSFLDYIGLTSFLEKLKKIFATKDEVTSKQSDWNVTDESSSSYIKNKPTSLPANGGNSNTVNNHTVNADVPSGAKFTDTCYGVATSSALGLVKSGTDITVDSNGNVSVNDDSHNHTIANVDGLQTALNGKAASSHTHNYAGSSSAGGSAMFADNLRYFRTTFTNDIGLNTTTANAIGYVNDTSEILGASDGAIYKQVYNDAWVHEIYGEYRTGQIAVRGKNNNTWQPWRIVLDSDNYTSYVPTNTSGATNTSSKLFLIGATSQAASPQTYSHDTVYVGTDGCLYSNSTRVVSEVTQSAEPTTQVVGDIWNQEY